MGSRRNYLKFIFFKVEQDWKRLDEYTRASHKVEFAAACDDFATDNQLFSYSLVGTRADADMMLLSSAPSLDDIHEFHVVLGQSGLAKHCTMPHSYLAMTRPSEYTGDERPALRLSGGKYLFVYPFVKRREWYMLPYEKRSQMMREHIETGRRYPSITINTSYSFGLDDQEFVVAFEGDDPGEFLDLVMELRSSAASSYTERDTPIFTCISMPVERMLNALDGAASAVNSQ